MNKDLDWSDVEADAARMETMQELLPEALEVLKAVGAENDVSEFKWTGEFAWTNEDGEEDGDEDYLWFQFESNDKRDVWWARLDDGSYWMLSAEEWGEDGEMTENHWGDKG